MNNRLFTFLVNWSSGRQPVTLSRREFLGVVSSVSAAGIVGSPALIGLTRKTERIISGGFADDGMTTGHSLRDGSFQPASGNIVRITVIVGGGIAGLSAAWELDHGVMISSCSSCCAMQAATRDRAATK